MSNHREKVNACNKANKTNLKIMYVKYISMYHEKYFQLHKSNYFEKRDTILTWKLLSISLVVIFSFLTSHCSLEN